MQSQLTKKQSAGFASFYSSIVTAILLKPVTAFFNSCVPRIEVLIPIKYFLPVARLRGRWNSSIFGLFVVINSSGTFIHSCSS